MQMIYCPNCQKNTGFKRVLGFGTFFMVLISCGLWLFVIPFYPARCITCGLTRRTAIFTAMPKWVQVTMGLVVLAFLCVILLTPSQSNYSVPIVKGPDYNEVPSTNTIPVEGRSRSVPVSRADEVISIDSTSLLAAYQADEGAANARYKNKRVAVTGVLSGVFIPSLQQMAAAGTGILDAPLNAFVTMHGPIPYFSGADLILPGIEAYSATSSLFGQRNIAGVADKLRIGETVTLACAFREASRQSGATGYSVSLDDCTLTNNPSEAFPLPSETPMSAVDAGNGAASDDASVVYHVGGEVSPPKAVFAPDPDYTDEARQNKPAEQPKIKPKRCSIFAKLAHRCAPTGTK